MHLPRITTLLGGVVSAGASVVCMGSMGAMAAGSAAGMSGMGAAAAASTTHHASALTQALDAIGLGSLTHVPNTVLQPLLIVLLLVTIASAAWRARRARSTPAIALAVLMILASIGMYASIYILVSITGYWVALIVLILASIMSLWSARRGRVLA